MVECKLDSKQVHQRTVSRYLNKNGFYMRQARKKGRLNDKDKRVRLCYARQMKRVSRDYPDYYTNHVAFCLDAVSFVHKNDHRKAAVQPKSRVWRKKGQGLAITAKGSKTLAGGRRLHVLAAVAWGKGIILSEVYEKMNGDFFVQFIRNNFNLCFSKAGPKADGKRLFVMDNDPCQTSKKAKLALAQIECKLHRIPPRSPDINPIDNIFHLVKKMLQKEAIEYNIITKESFDAFKTRVLRCMNAFKITTIDKTIESMPKSIEEIRCSKRKRSKY